MHGFEIEIEIETLAEVLDVVVTGGFDLEFGTFGNGEFESKSRDIKTLEIHDVTGTRIHGPDDCVEGFAVTEKTFASMVGERNMQKVYAAIYEYIADF